LAKNKHKKAKKKSFLKISTKSLTGFW